MAARLKILCVGRLKEKWQVQACAEYAKRLARYAALEVVEVRDKPDGDPRALQSEGEQLLRHISPEDFVVALAIAGETLDSPGLAAYLQERFARGATVALAIGGSNGLSEEVLSRADARLSFSDFTFPHGLMRVILLEQLYRACTINANHPYHK